MENESQAQLDLIDLHFKEAYSALAAQLQRDADQWGGPDHDDLYSKPDWLGFIRLQLEKGDRYDSHASFQVRMIKIAALALAAFASSKRLAAKRSKPSVIKAVSDDHDTPEQMQYGEIQLAIEASQSEFNAGQIAFWEAAVLASLHSGANAAEAVSMANALLASRRHMYDGIANIDMDNLPGL